MNLAFFKTLTEKEIVMSTFSSDAAVYMNAGGTERKGIELSVDAKLFNNFKTYLSYSYLDTQFKEAFTSQYAASTNQNVLPGNKIPGTYKNRAYAEVSWRYPSLGFFTAVEGIYSSGSFTNDLNSASADAYTIFNWKGSFQQTFNKFSVSEFVRIDNLTDQNYVSSVRVNDQNSRFYEPGSPTNWTVGINGNYKF